MNETLLVGGPAHILLWWSGAGCCSNTITLYLSIYLGMGDAILSFLYTYM